ncbi:MAG: hypothetical protein GX803_05515 [Lentisphaerae bacterium]|jgi:hypothetical protein|nr:hypothetical protein [Lentisphaerota bacterium]
MTTSRPRPRPQLIGLILAAMLLIPAVGVLANGNVHVSRFWHNHQPIYWPEWNNTGGQNSRVQFAWDSITLKSGQTFGGLSPANHPENNLTDIFGLDDRRTSYQSRATDSLNSFSGGGFAMSYSGSLIDNVNQLGKGGNLGYHSGWNNNYTGSRQGGRLDMLGFTHHHSLAPLLPKEVFRKEIQVFKQAWWKAWGGNSDLSDHSKGFFPTEMAFSQSLIDVLVDEGYEWTIVASHHLSRTCPTYFDQFNLDAGQYGIFSTPPNRADLLGPSPTSGWWYSEPNPGNAAWNVAPFAYQLHKAQWVNPESGATKQIYVVPSDDVLSYRFGYANEGIGKIQDNIAPYATDPTRPVIVMPSTDGDNAWGGGHSSWQEATPQFFNDSANAGYVKNTPQGFVNAAKANAPLTHVEDGAWIFPEMDYGSPNFLKWIEPPVNPNNIASCYPNTMVDLETPGFALKFFSYAPLMAGANWVITAEQILKDEGGSVQSWKIQDPYNNLGDGQWTSPNDVELAWHIYLAGLDSGFNYYGGLGNDDEVKPALATKNAIDKLQSFMSTRMHKDTTPPTLLKPQRFPYNPGGYTFGWYNRVPQQDERFLKKMDSEFYVWTHAYDVNGISDISVKVRMDNDGVNSMANTHNETYAGGSDVGSWITIPMTKRVLPKTRTELNTKADNGQIDYVVFDPAYWPNPVIADYYFAKITDFNVPGFRGKLLDYYVEATDGKGNVAKSDIQHVFVEHDGGQSSSAPSVTFDPAAPSDCEPLTVNFNAATSVLASASTVNLFYHFSHETNDWDSVVMTRTGTNTFSYTFNTVPDNAPQFECAFNDGSNWENNGDNNWKVAIRDCDSPTGPSSATFDPAAPSSCDPVVIRYYPNEGPLQNASAIQIHIGRNGWQDVIDPDPAMTKNGYFWEYTYSPPTNTTVIDVVFNNGSGIWDNNNGADWHVNVTGCGDAPPEPVGAVSISSAAACEPITITYNPSGRNLQGANPVKIHIGRNGWQDVILPNPSMTKSGANWTYQYTPLPGTTNINMVFNDGAVTWDNNNDANWNFDITECPDIPTGLAITSPAPVSTVPNATATITLSGVADGMTGNLEWTNKLTHASGSIPAASPWSVPGIELNVGANEIVVNGSNVVASGEVTNAYDIATDTAYSDGWNSGNNGGTGFSAWQLNAEEDTSGHFVNGNLWGLWSHEGHLSESIRPFPSALAVGQSFHVHMKNGWIWEIGGGIGVALQNASGDTLWEFYFNGGDDFYSITGDTTDIGWTDAGIDIVFTVTSAGNYSVDVTPVGGSKRTYTGTFTGDIARFRAWSYSNGTDDGQNENRDYFIGAMKITGLGEGGPAFYSDSVIVTRQTGSAAPEISNITPQMDGGSLDLSIPSSQIGVTYTIWASPTLFPTQNWQKVTGSDKPGTGGPVDLSITNTLLPVNFYRIGIE